jgi:carbon storage regulator
MVSFFAAVGLVLNALERKGVRDVLVVSRKVGERILIGDKIAVTVVKVGSGGVRIGIDAPTEMPIMREELAEQLRIAEREKLLQAERQSLKTAPSPNGESS